MRVPDGLGWWSAQEGGAEWLAALPGLAAQCAERWDLRLGDPFEPATISLVVPAERRDGTRAVLKVTFPEAETEHEAVANTIAAGVLRAELMSDPAPLARMRRRLDQLAEQLELERERIRGWAVVHAVAWGGETGPGWDPAMVACAEWLADA